MTEVNSSKVMYVEDIGDKRKIANLLLVRYSLDTTNYPSQSIALRDLIFCWSMRAYYVAAHEALRLFVTLETDEVQQMQVSLNLMFADVQIVITRIIQFYGESFNTQGLNHSNPNLDPLDS